MPYLTYWQFAAWVAQSTRAKAAPGFIVIPLTEAECRIIRAVRDLPVPPDVKQEAFRAAGAQLSQQFIFIEPEKPTT
jgi:hypothetical protein